MPHTIIPENSHWNISTLLGLCHSGRKAKVNAWTIHPNPVSPNHFQWAEPQFLPARCFCSDVYECTYMYIVLLCITVWSVPRPIADSNIRVEKKPRLTNFWVRNRPRAVAEVGRALFGTGEQTVGLVVLVLAPSHWVKSLCWCCWCWCWSCGCCGRPLSFDKCCFCGVVLWGCSRWAGGCCVRVRSCWTFCSYRGWFP